MITNVEGKRVLVRVDYNVPLNEHFEITDTTRIDRSLPTLRKLLEMGGSLILMAHFGRPQKKRKEDGSIDKTRFTLKHVVPYLSQKLDVQVTFINDCIGENALRATQNMSPGEVILLENTRFYKEEKDGDLEFAAKLSKHGDIYINDAFGAAHRAHASTATVARFFKKENRSFGLLMEAEMDNAQKVMKSPARPCVAIFGGAKVSDKIQLISRFMDFADTIVIGGGMSYTFFKYKEGNIGNSLCEDSHIELAGDLLDKASDYNVEFILPEDSVIADDFKPNANTKIVDSMNIPDGWMGLDVGPMAIQKIKKAIEGAGTIIWNGPLGVFEMEAFAHGSMEIAKAIAQCNAYSLVGGGDSVAAVKASGVSDQISFISTGGGAMLEFLEGKKLPGIQAIEAEDQ